MYEYDVTGEITRLASKADVRQRLEGQGEGGWVEVDVCLEEVKDWERTMSMYDRCWEA